MRTVTAWIHAAAAALGFASAVTDAEAIMAFISTAFVVAKFHLLLKVRCTRRAWTIV